MFCKRLNGKSQLLYVIIFIGFLTPTYATYYLVWSDEFDGTSIDTANWNHETGGYWHNEELQFYTDRTENSRVSGGNLIIEAREETYQNREHTSARMTTQGKAYWTYGKIEARMKLPTGNGMWPAFWLMPEAWAVSGWPACGEIDIMEAINDPDWVSGALHYGDSTTHDSDGQRYEPPGIDFSDDFHIYTLEWEPDEMRWYVDGNHFMTLNNWWSSEGPYPAPFNKDFFIILNIAVGGAWPRSEACPSCSPTDLSWLTASFPQQMLVDWVRVYQELNEGEFNNDNKIDYRDFALFGLQWLDTACGDCGGADMSGDGDVGPDDLQVLGDLWLTDYSLKGYWSLDGDADDSSLYSHSSTIYGSPAWDPNGITDQALVCDGSDDYIKIDNFMGIPGGQSRTVSAWIRTSQDDGEILTYGEMTTTGGRWVFRVKPGGYLNVQVGGGTISGTTVITDGFWHHVAAVLEDDGSPSLDEVKLYVDGTEEAVPGTATEINTIIDNEVKIGVFSDTAKYFEGLIDEVRIYDRALSQAEIDALFNMGQ